MKRFWLAAIFGIILVLALLLAFFVAKTPRERLQPKETAAIKEVKEVVKEILPENLYRVKAYPLEDFPVADYPVEETTSAWTLLSSDAGDLPEPGPGKQQTASLVLDVDQDGRLDFIIAERTAAPSLEWYRNEEDGWTRWIIDDQQLRIEAGGAFHDIDGDGDLDIVMGGDARSNQVWWWENPYPDFDAETPWVRRLIKDDGETKHHDQIFGDFDGDGQDELVFWNQNGKKLFLAEIPEDPKQAEPWPMVEIFSWKSGDYEGLAKADIDGDGVIDVVGGGMWFKYEGDDTYTPNVIDANQGAARAATGQLIPGGRPEVVFVAGDSIGPLKWYAWDGEKWSGAKLLGFAVDHGHSLEIADINNDGFLDIFVAEMRLHGENPTAGSWIFFGDGEGNFTTTPVSRGFDAHEAKLGDFDGDGHLDILVKPYDWGTPRVEVFVQNNKELNDQIVNGGEHVGDGALTLDSWTRHVIDDERPWKAIFIKPADLDGDGWPDIVSGGWWYRNPRKVNSEWQRRPLGEPLNNMAVIDDFDGDGDLDVLGTAGKGSKPNSYLAWARNEGRGNFTILDNIEPGGGDFLQGAVVGQFTADDQSETALSWHNGGPGVQLLSIPIEPSRKQWKMSRATETTQAEEISAGDIDRDGDIDMLLGTIWLRNDLPEGWTPLVLHAAIQPNHKPDRNRLSDINQDGRLDAVIGFEGNGKERILAWYEQPEDATNTWKEHVIDIVTGPMSLDVADMDGDSDLDVIVGEHDTSSPEQASLFVYENSDGQGFDWLQHLVYQGDEHHDGAQVVDIDKDGDLDILSIGWSHDRVLLYENLAISPTLN